MSEIRNEAQIKKIMEQFKCSYAAAVNIYDGLYKRSSIECKENT